MKLFKNISNNHVSDKELLSDFKKTGENKYIGFLFQRYMDLVFGVCLKYFKDEERSKDAVMDIFEALHTKLKQHDIENFKSWLHTVTRNHCLMQLRSPRNLKTTEFNPDFMHSTDNRHLYDGALEKEENLTKLEQCIETLPDDQKQSIELFYMQKKCYNEIAEISGCDLNKVKSYIQNGRRNLKICLEAKELKIKN